MRYKVVDLRHVLFESELDILAISETKLCDEFPDSQFVIEGYYHPAQFRKDRTAHGGGLIVYVRNGIPVRRVKTFEPPNQEIICLEIAINKRKWLIYSFYRSESFSDLTTFLEELKKSIDKAINKYENIVLMDDINVDMSDRNNTHTNYDHVQELSDVFNLTNLIKQTTCFTPTATHPSLIDIILTNRPRSFQSSVAIETGLSDHHKMVLKCHFVRLQPATIHYRDYKYFDPEAFINDIKDANLDAIVSLSDDPNSVYSDFCAHFKSILDLHAPLKSKTLQGNQAPFMSKGLSKAIMTRSRLKNKFNRQKTKANWKAYTLQRNKCVQLRKKAIKNHFSKSLDSGDMTNKTFWKTVRPFISNKGTHDSHDNRELKQTDAAAERRLSTSKFLFKRTQGQVNPLGP